MCYYPFRHCNFSFVLPKKNALGKSKTAGVKILINYGIHLKGS